MKIASANEIRSRLVDSLELDLIGPMPKLIKFLESSDKVNEASQLKEEILDRGPSRWYQNGFLIPSEIVDEINFFLKPFCFKKFIEILLYRF